MAEVYLDSILIGKVANKANYSVEQDTDNYYLFFNGNNTFTPYIQLQLKSILVVGGGGKGGHGGGSIYSFKGNNSGGGGGEGGQCTISESIFFEPNTTYTFTVGNGGHSNDEYSKGTNSKIIHNNVIIAEANGGVGGGNSNGAGSGRGGGVNGRDGGTSRQNAYDGSPSVVNGNGAGGGGGANDYSNKDKGGNGGAGITYENNIYGNGGKGGGADTEYKDAAANTGNGGPGGEILNGGNGGSGVIILTFKKSYIDKMIEDNTNDYVNFEKNNIRNDIRNDIQNKINVLNYTGGITVGYSPTDFYYVMANEAVPTDTECQNTYTTVLIPDTDCIPTDSKWDANKEKCLKKELCKNKENAQRIQQIQNNHLGSDQNYHDTLTLYKNEYAKMVNLSVGILAIIAVIFYSK
jgi:hypothetical protein